MPKPFIGLTTTCIPDPYGHPASAVSLPYITAIKDAGGLPAFIPNGLSEADLGVLLSRFDGVLFTGGYDVDPHCYGKPPHRKAVGIDADRDRTEIYLVQAMAQSGQPFLGICRGIQVINVALGGNLYEHLPDQLPGNLHTENHDKPRDFLAHTVTIRPGNRLAEILAGQQFRVNSLHHQGVRNLAPGLQVTATAPDGLVEGFELTGHPFALAVQWHPEELQEYEPMRRLFQAFVKACRTPSQRRLE